MPEIYGTLWRLLLRSGECRLLVTPSVAKFLCFHSGAESRACLKRSLTREAPTPTYISTKSEPLLSSKRACLVVESMTGVQSQAASSRKGSQPLLQQPLAHDKTARHTDILSNPSMPLLAMSSQFQEVPRTVHLAQASTQMCATSKLRFEMPLGTRAPSFSYFFGLLRKSTNSTTSACSCQQPRCAQRSKAKHVRPRKRQQKPTTVSVGQKRRGLRLIQTGYIREPDLRLYILLL